MFKCLMSSVAIGVVALVPTLVTGAAPAAVQPRSFAPAPPSAAIRENFEDAPVHHQMQALQDNARTGMILYTGSFSSEPRTAAIALALHAVPR